MHKQASKQESEWLCVCVCVCVMDLVVGRNDLPTDLRTLRTFSLMDVNKTDLFVFRKV
jgi:hypothetical protein